MTAARPQEHRVGRGPTGKQVRHVSYGYQVRINGQGAGTCPRKSGAWCRGLRSWRGRRRNCVEGAPHQVSESTWILMNYERQR